MRVKRRFAARGQSGVTLVELLVAVAVLLIAVVPIFGMYQMSIRTNAISRKVTLATFVAQQKIEEFVGLKDVEIVNELINDAGSPAINETSAKNYPDYNGFRVDAWYSTDEDEDGDSTTGSNALYIVYVKVYDSDGISVLCKQSNIINVKPGGVA